MQAAILAAGRGTRLGQITEKTPKALLQVGSQTLISRQLDALLEVGVSQVLVVVGYRQELIAESVQQAYPQVRFVTNPRFEKTNTIYSLYLAFPQITEDFFYLNGDVLMGPGLLRKLMAEKGHGLAVEYKDCGDEEVKVRLAEGRICEISKQVVTAEAEGEFTGIALFRRSMHEHFYESLKLEVEQRDNVQDYFEKALDNITDEVALVPIDVGDEPVIEIDFPEDLVRAREMVPRLERP